MINSPLKYISICRMRLVGFETKPYFSLKLFNGITFRDDVRCCRNFVTEQPGNFCTSPRKFMAPAHGTTPEISINSNFKDFTQKNCLNLRFQRLRREWIEAPHHQNFILIISTIHRPPNFLTNPTARDLSTAR